MKKPVIRKSNENDIISINKLFAELIKFESRFSNNITSNIQIEGDYNYIFNDDKSILFVVELDNKIIGFIYAYEKELDEVFINKEVFIEAIFILEKYRNKGIGKLLMKELEKWCYAKNIKYIDIDVMKNNKEALSLYGKIGYKEVKIGLRKELL